MTLSAVGIACKDIEKSISFYEIFNLKFTKYGDDHYEATTNSGVRIMLDTFKLMKDLNPDWKEPLHPGITLCFEEEDAYSVDKTYKKIISSGYKGEKEPWDAPWGQRYSSVRDPDGNLVDIFANIK